MNKKQQTNYPSRRPPGYRQKLLTELRARYPRYDLKSNLLGGLFLSGIAFTIWEIYIYRVTFISVYIPMSIWLSTGSILTPILKKTFNIYCFNPYTPGQTPISFHYLYNIVAFGGIMMFLFMWTNQHFNDNSKTVESVAIVSVGHLAKSGHDCGEPYAQIVFNGKQKELMFPCGKEIEKYSRVYIEITKGLFGFDVITNKTLIQGQW